VNLIPMYVDLEPIAKSKITNPSVLVREDLLVIHLFHAGNSPVKTCAFPILVDQVPNANLEMTGLVQIDPCVLVLLDIVVILWFLVQEVNAKMIVNAEVIKPVSISLAKTLVKMLVESVLNAKLSIMVPSVLVPMDTWVTRLQLAELPEIHHHLSNKDRPTRESLDCPDSSVLLITLLVSFNKNIREKLK